jgi:hypothetical protein
VHAKRDEDSKIIDKTFEAKKRRNFVGPLKCARKMRNFLT